MALIGKGAVAIWNGIKDEGRAEFFAWHNREHILERVTTEGFQRGRRYIALEGHPEFFTLYEVDDVGVLSSPAYLARLAAPTDWTQRAVPHFTDVARALTRVVVSTGLGGGGVVATLRFETSDEAALAITVHEAAERILAAHPAITGIHLCCADLAASSIETAERKARSGGTEIPQTVLMIEGTDAAIVRLITEKEFPDQMLARHGAANSLRGLYRHEISISRQELSA